MNAKAISEEQPEKGCSPVLLIPFGFIFFAAGTFFFWMTFLAPLIESYQAKSWPSAKCKITHSKVKVHADSDGNSYKPIVKFEFTVDGINFKGDRPTLQDISGSKKWAQRVVKRYPLGTIQTCYFDSNPPQKSVLSRDFELSFYTFSLFPLLFVVVGGFIMGAGVRGLRKDKSELKNEDQAVSGKPIGESKTRLWAPDSENAEQADFIDKEWSLPRKLKPDVNRLTSLLMGIVFMLFWNGIVGVFVYQLFDRFEIFLAIFLIPFVLVGLLLMAGVAYLFLSLFNPVIKIGMSSGAISPGNSVDVAWQVVGGKASRFKKLRIHIYGEQSATYRQGTSTVTDDETFELVEVVETENLDEIEFGSATVTIPLDTMHTFTAEHNKVRWTIAVHGKTSWMPDVHQSYTFRVKPV